MVVEDKVPDIRNSPTITLYDDVMVGDHHWSTTPSDHRQQTNGDMGDKRFVSCVEADRSTADYVSMVKRGGEEHGEQLGTDGEHGELANRDDNTRPATPPAGKKEQLLTGKAFLLTSTNLSSLEGPAPVCDDPAACPPHIQTGETSEAQASPITVNTGMDDDDIGPLCPAEGATKEVTEEPVTLSVSLSVQQSVPVPKKSERKCIYTKGGKCKFHGLGASRIWEPRTVTTTGPGGVKKVEVVRKYGWRCDLSVGGNTKLKQTDISAFLGTSAKKTGGGPLAGSRQPERTFSTFSDDTVGQGGDHERTVAHRHVSQERLRD